MKTRKIQLKKHNECSIFVKCCLSISLLLMAIPTIYGVNYNGRVIDRHGKPHRQAIILNRTNKSADYTDPNGCFSLRVEKGDTLVVRTSDSEVECVFVESMQGQDICLTNKNIVSLRFPGNIPDKVIDYMAFLYSSERYKECIAYGMYYVDYNLVSIIEEMKHPYKDWRKEYSSYLFWPDIEDVAIVCYLGSAACYQRSLTVNEPITGVYGVPWSMTCASIYNDYLQELNPSKYWSTYRMNDYIKYGERGTAATSIGIHLLKALDPEDQWVKNMKKRYNQYFKSISATLYKKVNNLESEFPNAPLVQYKISTIKYNYNIEKGQYKDFETIFNQRKDALIRYIEKITPNYDVEVYSALNTLTSLVVETALDRDMQKKIGRDMDRFCMEELIKLQDLSYHLNGSSIYSSRPNYTLRDIQNQLKEDECAIMHFEGQVMNGSFFWRYDLGTTRRNYAYAVTKNIEIPILWHRGYVSNEEVNGLDKIKADLPNIKKFYYVGTPRMAFIDIAGKDSSIVRLHSLSQLLEERTTNVIGKDITFIGDLNYHTIGDYSKYKGGGEKYGTLQGPAEELKYIKWLFGTKVKPITGDDASKKNVLMSLHNKSIVHFSTHGTTSFNPERIFNASDLILKNDVLVNSGLILSGYNDNPDSPSAYLSGADILNLRKLNTSIVFLDACSSGHGKVGVAGSVGIAEALHLVGVKNIICYLSPIKDQVATQFSNAFYSELSRGETCHEAFFNAKNSMDQEINVVLWE